MLQFLFFLSIVSLCLCVDIFSDSHFGVRRRTNQPLAIGGSECDGTYGFMVSLQRHGRHVCGGTLVNAHWVLTAAQCGSGFRAVIGQKKLTFNGEVCDYNFVHPEFDNITLVNDIQMVHIVNAQYKCEIVHLPLGFVHEERHKLCKTGTVVGWGYMEKDKYEVSSTLNCIKVKTLILEKCQLFHGRELPGNICSDSCDEGAANGDAGSPLMCGMVQYGIVSWGWGCDSKLPVVYTNTHFYLDFIQAGAAYHLSSPIHTQEPLEDYEDIPPPPQPQSPTGPSVHPPILVISASTSLSLNFMVFCKLLLLKFLC